MSSNLYKNNVINQLFTNKLYIYIYKQDLTLNNPQELIFHKTPTNQSTNQLKLNSSISMGSASLILQDYVVKLGTSTSNPR